jgi:hypothetical protein
MYALRKDHNNSKIKKDVPEFDAKITLHQDLQIVPEWFENQGNRVDLEREILENHMVSLYNHWSDQMKNLYTK